MTTVFNLCKILILGGRTSGLTDKMDIYLANDRLTTDEYSELMNMMKPKETTDASK